MRQKRHISVCNSDNFVRYADKYQKSIDTVHTEIYAIKNLKNCNQIVDSFCRVIYNVKAVEVRV